jgi:transposase
LLPDIQAALDERELVPAEHLVDAGYVCADHFVTSQTTYGTALIAPAPPDTSWQARESPGFAIPQFAIDWDAQTVTCPQGHASVAWKPGRDHHTQAVITVRFDPAACQACPVRAQCTHAPARVLVIRPQPQFEALQAARARETTPEFQAQYAARAGVEGTIAQAVRSYDVRQARYIGLAKTHLQHLATAVATNLARVAAWLEEVPRAITRVSAFAALAPA